VKRSALLRRTPLKAVAKLQVRKPMKKKSKRPATKAEKEYMNRVTALGCVACEIDGNFDTPCGIHHPRHGEDGQNVGTGGRSEHTRGIGLCEGHHQGLLDTTKIAIHRDPEGFTARYGTEEELVALTHFKLYGSTDAIAC